MMSLTLMHPSLELFSISSSPVQDLRGPVLQHLVSSWHCSPAFCQKRLVVELGQAAVDMEEAGEEGTTRGREGEVEGKMAEVAIQELKVNSDRMVNRCYPAHPDYWHHFAADYLFVEENGIYLPWRLGIGWNWTRGAA